jgi:hypothetical protein
MTTAARTRGGGTLAVPVGLLTLRAGGLRRLWFRGTTRARCEALVHRGGRCLRVAGYAQRMPGRETDTLICGVHRGELERNGSLEVLA